MNLHYEEQVLDVLGGKMQYQTAMKQQKKLYTEGQLWSDSKTCVPNYNQILQSKLYLVNKLSYIYNYNHLYYKKKLFLAQFKSG